MREMVYAHASRNIIGMMTGEVRAETSISKKMK